jgi:hypothetical protein
MKEGRFEVRILWRLEFLMTTIERPSYPTRILISDLWLIIIYILLFIILFMLLLLFTYFRSKVPIAVDIKTVVFWHETLCSLVED